MNTQGQPFHSRVGVESVELELAVMGSIGTTNLLVVSAMALAYSEWEALVVCKAVIAPKSNVFNLLRSFVKRELRAQWASLHQSLSRMILYNTTSPSMRI